MALDTYANLKTAIGVYLGRVQASDLSDFVDDLIVNTQKEIERNLRIKEMEKSLSSTISMSVSGTSGIAIPSDFLDFAYCKFHNLSDSSNTEYILEIKDARWIRENYVKPYSTSRPRYIGVEGQNFIFGPFPDVTTYLLTGVYYAKQTTMSASVTDNTIFNTYPDIYLYGCLKNAEAILGRDQRTAVWQQKYLEIREAIRQLNTMGNDRMVPTQF